MPSSDVSRCHENRAWPLRCLRRCRLIRCTPVCPPRPSRSFSSTYCSTGRSPGMPSTTKSATPSPSPSPPPSPPPSPLSPRSYCIAAGPHTKIFVVYFACVRGLCSPSCTCRKLLYPENEMGVLVVGGVAVGVAVGVAAGVAVGRREDVRLEWRRTGCRRVKVPRPPPSPPSSDRVSPPTSASSVFAPAA